ncbi:MAG: methionine--tRNA ligase [Nitrospirota bacterium]
MADTFYITTPIYYVNDVPHIGHAYTTVAADTMARYMRLTGREVFFLTGTDEHGQKVEKTAADKGMTNREFVDSIVPRFRGLWEKLDIEPDDFIRTTEERHVRAVQHMFSVLKDKGDIYKGEYEDWYCVPCESFWTSLQLGKGDTCPDCGRPVEKLKEESYFFRLSRYGGEDGELTRYLEANRDFVVPESRFNEVLSFVKGGLRDLSISRTSFKWGVPVPGDEKHVIYVWLDALMNYLTALGYPDTDSEKFRKFWPSSDPVAVHVIGKDILRFHAVYWPAFLMAAGLPLPKRIVSHGWWTIGGEKMSKSKGNVVDPFAVVEELDRHGIGADGFRYFLLREVPFGLDGDYSREALVNRINSDLANDLGNLHFRTINMIEKYLGGEIPILEIPDNSTPQEALQNFFASMIPGNYDVAGQQAIFGIVSKYYKQSMDKLDFSDALDSIWALISVANKTIDYSAPWNLAKSEKTEDRRKLEDVLGVAAEVLKVSAITLYPFMPSKMQLIWEQLGHTDRLDEKIIDISDISFFIYEKGQKIKRGPAPFPRIETDRIRALKAASDAAAAKPAAASIAAAVPLAAQPVNPPSPLVPPPTSGGGLGRGPQIVDAEAGGVIGIDDFMKVDLRVGKVLEAERVPKSDKLVKMKIDIGAETRQIVGGIGKAYPPEELVGRTVIVVANLKPAKLMGIESQGMVLAAGGVDTLRLVGFDDAVVPGTKVK